MQELLSIKEFSKLTGIETTTLRYWDDIGLFTPIKRDPQNSYRYYAPEQLITVKFVTVLSDLNVPLKNIHNEKNERTPEKVIKLIDHQERLLNEKISNLYMQHSLLITRRELINYGLEANEHEIVLTHREGRRIILGPPNELGNGETLYQAFADFYSYSDKLNINSNFPIGGYYKNLETFMTSHGQPDCFFSLDPRGSYRCADGQYVVGYTRGFYGQYGDLPERIADFVKKNSIKATGPVYSLYLHDEICVKDPSQYLVRVCIATSE